MKVLTCQEPTTGLNLNNSHTGSFMFVCCVFVVVIVVVIAICSVVVMIDVFVSFCSYGIVIISVGISLFV